MPKCCKCYSQSTTFSTGVTFTASVHYPYVNTHLTCGMCYILMQVWITETTCSRLKAFYEEWRSQSILSVPKRDPFGAFSPEEYSLVRLMGWRRDTQFTLSPPGLRPLPYFPGWHFLTPYFDVQVQLGARLLWETVDREWGLSFFVDT